MSALRRLGFFARQEFNALAAAVNRLLAYQSGRATSDLDLFINSDSGNDSNDGLTANTPLRTLEAAYLAAPYWSIGGGVDHVTLNFAGLGGFGAAAQEPLLYEANSMMVPWQGHAERWQYHHRGAHMVRATTLATGPASGDVDTVTNLWWAPSGSARARVESVNSPGADYVLGGVKVSRAGGANWTISDGQAGAARYARITRNGRKVIFECPIAQLGADHFILDISTMPDGTKPSDAILAGDTWEIVQPSVILISPSSRPRIGVEGMGGGQGCPGDYLGTVQSRGGGGCWAERLAFASSFMASGVEGMWFDRCDFRADSGDENYMGGSGGFINCLHTSLGVILHRGWSSLHDSANCRPDVASDDPALANPLYQDVDAFSMWGVCRGGCRLFVGSGTSSSPAFLTLERNYSCYDAQAQAALFVGYASRFRMLDQRNRQTQIQGTGNILGIDVQGGSQAQYTLLGGLNGPCPMAHLLGDNGLGLDADCRLGSGPTHTWDEVYAGGSLPAGSGPNNWLYNEFNNSRLTAYDG